MSRTVKTVAWTVLTLALLGAGGALLFIYSGIYPIAADQPHYGVVQWLLTTLQERSVGEHAEDIEVPPLYEPVVMRRGFVLYQEHCLVCHGAPGVPRRQIGRGINPNPPPLFMAASEWSDAELYWIIKHGLKMAGMPGFDAGHTETDLWALTAFSRRLPELSVEEYRAMVVAIEGGAATAEVEWVDDDDPGFGELIARGDAARGRGLIREIGCGSCHVIPGIPEARGRAGPPLIRWAERHYIAGALLNHPRNLVDWIVDPQEIEPGTAMPDLGVTPEEALDIAAYLFTLGDPPERLDAALAGRAR